MNRYEIGERDGKNIFYTGYTFNAENKNAALNHYKMKSGSKTPDKDIIINEIATNVKSDYRKELGKLG